LNADCTLAAEVVEAQKESMVLRTSTDVVTEVAQVAQTTWFRLQTCPSCLDWHRDRARVEATLHQEELRVARRKNAA
jgi:hypothetical protein